MTAESWVDFWREHASRNLGADEQTQVLRTSSGHPIDVPRWKLTLREIDRVFPVGPGDDMLDLCCGNGLLATHFAGKCRSVLAVDASPDLLAVLTKRRAKNIATRCLDARDLECEDGQFSRILFYAGLQYFDAREAVLLFRKFSKWLRPGGSLFVGDIPDQARLWNFYNTPERRGLYFDNVASGRDVVGTWYESEWLVKLADACGFTSAARIAQHQDLIYSHFRYDFLAIR